MGISTSGNQTTVDRECEMILVQQIVGVIITGFVILLGLTGNTLSFALLTRTKRSSMFIILQALLLSDSVLLVFYFASQILPNLFEYDENSFFILAHKIHGYLLKTAWPLVMTAQMTSVWLNVLISVERWFAVCKPFMIGALLSKGRTRKCVAGIFFVALVYNIPRYFEYDLCVRRERSSEQSHSHRSLCGMDQPVESPCLSESELFNQTMTSSTWIFVQKSEFGESDIYANTYCAILYCLLMFVLPVTLIGVLNVMTIVQLHKSRRQWSVLSRRQRQEERITLLPIWIVGIFCVCSTPSTLVNIIDARITVSYQVIATLTAVTNLLVTLNSAINCIIYCAFTRKFRELFLQIICRRNKQIGTSLRSTITGTIYDRQIVCIDGKDSGKSLRDNARKNSKSSESDDGAKSIRRKLTV